MPPSSAQEVETYLTKHDLSDILSKALNACVQAQPDAPLPFLIDELKGGNAGGGSSEPRSAQSVEEYLAKHQLSDVLSDTLNATVQALADDPVAHMAAELKKKAGGGPAYSASHTGAYACSAAAMWASISEWAPAHLVDVGPGTLEGVEGTGVGAVRTVLFPGPDGNTAKWTEKVTAFDADAMTWSYTCTSAVPFPIDIDTFVCTFSVKSTGADTCEATIGCVYDSDAPEAMEPMLGPMYKSWADASFDAAKRTRPETAATINIGYIVPKEDADRVQGVITKHTEWMKVHYAGSTEKLISCYFTKAPLFNVPTDPSQGESDKILFTLNEEFTGPDKVAAHIEAAKGNDYFPEFGEILGKYGVEGGVVQALGNVWFKLDAARCEGKRPKTGATINILYIVPKDKADEVQATITKHTEWMKGHYGGSTDALISAYFTKAPKFNDPTDPSKGESDDVIFTINEEFTGPDKVAAHIETAKGNDYFADFGKVLHDYGKVVQPLGQVWFAIR